MDQRTVALDDEQDARHQFIIVPKWLEFSGTWQAFGRRHALAGVARAAVEIDHSTDGLASRRHGDDLRTFAAPLEDVARVAGCDLRTAGRAAQELADIGLLEVYKPGGVRTWSHFRVNRDVMAEVYRYAAPRLRKVHGGIWDHKQGNPDDRALMKTRVYGVQKPDGALPEAVYVDDLEMLRLWRDRPQHYEWPDPAVIAEILDI